jgi:hypothetical protein
MPLPRSAMNELLMHTPRSSRMGLATKRSPTSGNRRIPRSQLSAAPPWSMQCSPSATSTVPPLKATNRSDTCSGYARKTPIARTSRLRPLISTSATGP